MENHNGTSSTCVSSRYSGMTAICFAKVGVNPDTQLGIEILTWRRAPDPDAKLVTVRIGVLTAQVDILIAGASMPRKVFSIPMHRALESPAIINMIVVNRQAKR